MKKENENYYFDLMISSEDLKANQKRILEKENKTQKRLNKKRLIKFILITLLTIVSAMLFMVLANNSKDNWNYWANKCDTNAGYTCSYYEIRQLMIRGE